MNDTKSSVNSHSTAIAWSVLALAFASAIYLEHRIADSQHPSPSECAALADKHNASDPSNTYKAGTSSGGRCTLTVTAR